MTAFGRNAVQINLRNNGSFHYDADESCLSPTHNFPDMSTP
jgi:hypothetical protein